MSEWLPVAPATLLAFAATAFAIVVSPGPDTFWILRCALGAGALAGLAAVLGVQLGLLVHTGLAAVGLTAVIASSPGLFRLVAVAGALYLGWIGVQGFRERGPLALTAEGAGVGPARALRAALVTNVLNPKVIVLFFALYPNFLALERGHVTAQLVTLSALLIAINIAWQAPMALAAHLVRRWLLRPRSVRLLARLSGAVLVLFALLMLYEHVWRGPAP